MTYLTMAWGLISSGVGKWIAIAVLLLILLGVGTCTWQSFKDGLREEGRQEIIDKQKDATIDTLKKGTAARRDVGTDSERDRRLRKKFCRDCP